MKYIRIKTECITSSSSSSSSNLNRLTFIRFMIFDILKSRSLQTFYRHMNEIKFQMIWLSAKLWTELSIVIGIESVFASVSCLWFIIFIIIYLLYVVRMHEQKKILNERTHVLIFIRLLYDCYNYFVNDHLRKRCVLKLEISHDLLCLCIPFPFCLLVEWSSNLLKKEKLNPLNWIRMTNRSIVEWNNG